MKLHINIIIIFSIFTNLSFAQQIGDGRALEITDFSAPLKSGVYQGSLPIGMNPDNQVYGWQHLFVIRHSNDTNNHQLQLSSSYAENDRLFFRKISTGILQPLNPAWNELATRGSNNFVGEQSVSGGIISSTHNDIGGYLSLINTSKNSPSIAQRWSIYNMTGPYGNGLQFWAYDNSNCTIPGMCGPRFTIMDNGNVGIGTTNPTSLLTVAGNINSREVKVTVDAGADFVFDNNYKLPSLDSVERYVKENKHLPEIASASEMQKEGINLSEMNIKLLQKIEELTLYAIEQNKKIESQSKEIESLKDLVLRVSKIENELARK